ncbi:MAG TPA: NAD(P)-dependent oxidoreductase [Bryobacteraceae bacterium]|nr:NAD(P)-dependent oxidoreductase [Bryobacteraceae bacterium]
MDTEITSVGVIGLGIMGGAFARHFVEAGLRTLGYDPLESPLHAFAAAGGHACESARAVAAEADLLITSLPDAAALDDVLRGIISAQRPGLIVVETSTLSLPEKEVGRARLADSGIAMLDAPISGTGPQAQAKDIIIFASGDQADFDQARGVLAHLTHSIRYVGAFGAGTKLKLIANLLVAVHIMAAAEALVLGEKAGFDATELVDLLVHSAATSRMLEVRGPSMAAGAYMTPMMKADVFQKDLKLIAEFASASGAPVPVFGVSAAHFLELSARGMGGYDTAAVIAILRQKAASL